LKTFIFGQLDNHQFYSNAIVDKLASSGALIACSMFLNSWPTLIEDLIEFMKKSFVNLKNGLIVLERIP
jgi:hypothetical protein